MSAPFDPKSPSMRLWQALLSRGVDAEEATVLMNGYAHELAEQQRSYAEEEWTGSDARMILRRRVARHLADLIDPLPGPVRPDEEPTP